MSPSPRVLLVDDDPALLDALALAFEDAGHVVETAPDGQRALDRARRAGHGLDAIVSDVNMPGLDGFTLCRRLREAGDGVPFVMLTSRDGEIDEALGLELGADDYVVKPFSTRVLLARVASLLRRDKLRRLPGTKAEDRVIARGDLRILVDRIAVHWRDVAIPVTVTELRMLQALVERAGIVLTRDRLLELVRGDGSVVAERIVDTYVRRIRRKLESVDPSFDAIETVIGAGYRWRA